MIVVIVQLVKNYSATSCTLHVRVTNSAALKLYTDTLGYQVKSRISNYYLDGEDAYNLTVEQLADQVNNTGKNMLYQSIHFPNTSSDPFDQADYRISHFPHN